MSMKNLTIKARLIFVLGFLSTALAAIGGLGIYGMNQSNAGLLSVYEDSTVPAIQIADIRAMIMRNRMLALDAVNNPANDVIRASTTQINENQDQISRLWTRVMDSLEAGRERELAEQFQNLRRQFVSNGLDATMQALQAGDLETAYNVAYDVMEPAYEPLVEKADELLQYQADSAAREYEAASALYARISTITIFAVILAVLVAASIGWIIVRAVVLPLNEAVRVANAIADGDLTNRIEVNNNDETGRMLDAMRRMSQRLQQLIQEVTDASLSVASGASQIAAGNVSLSQRTEEQASSLEETASSMEEMTSTVRQSAENAGQANVLATEARGSAEKGGAVVAKAVEAMSEINRSSKKVADIIGVIDEIAFQTNLLALNAAVEAARAGEQGRGFAVVASEVRNLAQRSASSAKEIKDLIEDSVQKVNQGAELVENSGTTLSEIITRVNKVTDIVAEIAAASEEQSSGIEQVNKAVMQLDELTQQNAALVEQASASSQSMSERANTLHGLVAQYRISAADTGRQTQRDEYAQASTTPKPESVAAALPAGVKADRRRKSRPWTNSQSGKVATGAPAPAPRAAAGHDTEWEEF